jgi:flavin reductase (DIM6/NTAB) family NADH-FMN oxidoreductase RutF
MTASISGERGSVPRDDLLRAREPRSLGSPVRPVQVAGRPRPIGWISTISGDGRVNLAPYSFFNAVAEGPPMLAFSSRGAKDSATFATEIDEFVWNLVTYELAGAMNETSAPLERGHSKFERAGLEMAPSRLVGAPRVAASPCAMECKVVHHLELQDLDGNTFEQHLVIGQVVGVHLDERHIAGGGVDTASLHTIARCGAPGDCALVERTFEMLRPKA